ncbi:MAG: urease accessory protein UreD [Pseudomonadota bacterium]
MNATLINTSGGLTSGDQFEFSAIAGTASCLTLSTQAAERAYRATDGPAKVTNKLSVAAGATLNWLPQELIVFDGCNIERSLEIDLSEDARLLLVEPVIFGRTAMGESVHEGRFQDRIAIHLNNQLIFIDAVKLIGPIAKMLRRRALAGSGLAMAGLVYVGADAEAHLHMVRNWLPQTAGATLIRQNMMVCRLLASDGYELRRVLIPLLNWLSGNRVPRTWRL